jgi:starvation-inducible DNA-binding protein
MDIGLNETVRKDVSEVLGRLLANEYFLYLKTLNYHWNVTGENFISLHQLLESQYEWLIETVDEIAERIRTLGFVTPATYKEFSKKELIIKENEGNQTSKEMLTDLVKSHEALIRELRNDIKKMDGTEDYGTEDMMIQWLEGHEKRVWMLRSHLQQKPGG